MQFILTLFFAIPAVADLALTLPLLIQFFGIQIPPVNVPGYPVLLLAGVIVSISTYLILLVAIIASFAKKKHRFQTFAIALCKRHRQIITVSTTLSLSTFLILFIPSVFPKLMSSDYETSSSMLILMKLLTIAVITTALSYIPPQKGIRILTAIALSIITGFLIWGCVGIVQEFLPRLYGTFTLNDTKAKYIINYDGDYWVTYYEVRNVCQPKQECREVLEKRGNTSITESPVDLKPFIDRSVRITGTFEPINDQVEGTKKKLCIGTGFQKKCAVSTGPGVWHSSPLKIESITTDQ